MKKTHSLHAFLWGRGSVLCNLWEESGHGLTCALRCWLPRHPAVMQGAPGLGWRQGARPLHCTVVLQPASIARERGRASAGPTALPEFPKVNSPRGKGKESRHQQVQPPSSVQMSSSAPFWQMGLVQGAAGGPGLAQPEGKRVKHSYLKCISLPYDFNLLFSWNGMDLASI